MKKTLPTALQHALNKLDYVEFVMKKIRNGLEIHDIEREFVEDNPFGIRSESTRKTYINWIVKSYVKGFKIKELRIFAKVIADEKVHPQVKREILFWKNCLSDELARSITTDFILKKHQSMGSFKRKELVDFVSERVSLSPSTVDKCVSGYLGTFKKIGFFSFEKPFYESKFYRPHVESVIFLLFYLLNSKHTPSQIIKSKEFKYLLITEDDLISMLKEIQLMGLISFAMSGDVVRLDPKIEFEAVPDALRS